MTVSRVYTTIGASNHTDKERQTEDYYATEPKAAQLLLDVEDFAPTIWECACGEGHLSQVFEDAGHTVISSDLVDRGFGFRLDFLEETIDDFDGDIVTNPPYKTALEFVQTALESVNEGRKVAMFLKLTFLEGKKRKAFFEQYPPKTIYVASQRLNCAMNGDFVTYAHNNAICYAWFVWVKGWKGDTVIKWIN